MDQDQCKSGVHIICSQPHSQTPPRSFWVAHQKAGEKPGNVAKILERGGGEGVGGGVGGRLHVARGDPY